MSCLQLEVIALEDQPMETAILTGIGLPDDGLHSPNEKLDLSQLWNGIKIFGRFFELFAEKGAADRAYSSSSGETRRMGPE